VTRVDVEANECGMTTGVGEAESGGFPWRGVRTPGSAGFESGGHSRKQGDDSVYRLNVYSKRLHKGVQRL
jgi:hypothetical protein